MKINNEEVSIEQLVSDINPRANMKKNYGNDIYLSDQEIEVLKRYHFDYQNYSSLKSLIFDIEDYLNDNYSEESEDLETLANNLSEFNYYHNTNK